MTATERGIPGLICVYVIALLFLPVLEISCPGAEASWTGLTVVTGGEGKVEGDLSMLAGNNDLDLSEAFGAQIETGEISADPTFASVFAFALLTLFGLALGNRKLAVTGGILLLGSMLFFAINGLAQQRELIAALEQAGTGGGVNDDMGMGSALIGSILHQSGMFQLAVIGSMILIPLMFTSSMMSSNKRQT